MLSTINIIPAILTILWSFASISWDLFLPKNVSAPPDTKPDRPDDFEDCKSTHTIMTISITSNMPIPIYFNTSMTDSTVTRANSLARSIPSDVFYLQLNIRLLLYNSAREHRKQPEIRTLLPHKIPWIYYIMFCINLQYPIFMNL